MLPYKGLPKEIYVLFIGKIVNCIGGFVHPLMSLILVQKIGLSPAQTGLFVTILAACQAPCIILGGKLADSIGRRKVIIVFQLLGACTLVICGIIPTSILTAKIMILSSCLYSISTPSYDALNADLTNKSNRKSSYSLLYMGVNIGFAIGPIIGGLLYEKYLPAIFIGDAITTLLSLGLFIKFIKDKNIKQVQENKEVDELEEEVKVSTLKIFLQRPILILFPLVMFLYQFSYGQWGFAVPIQMGEIFGANGAKLYGLLGGFNGIIVILFTPILTSITKKHNIINVMSLGGIMYAICYLIIGLATNMIFFFAGIFALTIGEVLIAINSATFIANNTPSSHRGRVSSILPLISGAGYSVGPMVMGALMDYSGNFIAWMIVTLVSVIGSILMVSINKLSKLNI
ncbi:MAG: MFS transporter [Romboutsia sp.]